MIRTTLKPNVKYRFVHINRLADCVFNVSLNAVIEYDPKKKRDAIMFSWEAFSNNHYGVRYRQRRPSRTRRQAIEDWEKFAKVNGLKLYQWMVLLEDRFSQFFSARYANEDRGWAALSEFQRDRRDKMCAITNQYSFLWGLLNLEYGPLSGNDTLASRKKKQENMAYMKKKDPTDKTTMWDEFNRIEKIINTHDLDAVDAYNDLDALVQYNPERWKSRQEAAKKLGENALAKKRKAS